MLKKVLGVLLSIIIIIPSTMTLANNYTTTEKKVIVLTNESINEEEVDIALQEFVDVNNVVEYDITDELSNESIQDNSIFAVNINEVNLEPELKALIRELYENDKTIYVYGGLTIDDYTEILGIEELVTYSDDDEFGYVEFALGSGNDESGILMEDDSNLFTIIGYSKKKIAHIIGIDVVGELSDEMQIAHIVNQEDKVDAESRLRGVERIDSSPSDTTTHCYNDSNKLMGSIGCRWELYRDLGEVDPNYDYFAIRPKAWTNNYNNYVCTKGIVKVNSHTLGDYMSDYQPKSTKYGSWNINLNLPTGSVTATASLPTSGTTTASADWNTNFVTWTTSTGGEILPVFSWRTKATNRRAACLIFIDAGFSRSSGGEYRTCGSRMISVSKTY